MEAPRVFDLAECLTRISGRCFLERVILSAAEGSYSLSCGMTQEADGSPGKETLLAPRASLSYRTVAINH